MLRGEEEQAFSKTNLPLYTKRQSRGVGKGVGGEVLGLS